jgi:hypothetical protein
MEPRAGESQGRGWNPFPPALETKGRKPNVHLAYALTLNLLRRLYPEERDARVHPITEVTELCPLLASAHLPANPHRLRITALSSLLLYLCFFCGD